MRRSLNIKNFNIGTKFHIVGIGGIGMSGIAEILHNLGFYVQGSDMSHNQNIDRLSKHGIKVKIGHDKSNIDGADYVVVSSSITENNIELQEAVKRKIPVVKRFEILAEIMKIKTCISVSGSHGKTSTTSIIASLFESAGLDPTVINGGIINNKSTNAYIGKGEFMIVEADESDGTFIKIPSSIGVITNIDPEHLDFYKNFDNLLKAFGSFIENLPFYGFAAVCIDNENVRKITSKVIDKKIITYGIDSTDANIKAYDIKTDIDGSRFNVSINLPQIKYEINNLYLKIPGRHNILNCLAAIAVAAELDFGVKAIKNGLAKFDGVKRRFTLTHEENGVRFIDDYAHHPSEIDATIKTAKSVLNNGKLITVFQPHRYSRLFHLFDDFIDSFSLSDKIILMDVYSAGETQIEDYNSNKLAKAIQDKYPSKEVIVLKDIENDLSKHLKLSEKGDIVLFMGAGNITAFANNISALLK